MANKINRTDIYPLTTPADDDFVIGTDVSDTSNDANGETVSFSIAAIRAPMQDILSEGAFVDGDKTKLDGIETNATADQTGAEIKTALFAEDDTNNLTDALLTKINGIETAADVTDTAKVTAAGALMESEVTNLAAVKAFDPADYATAAQGVTADSALQAGDDADALGSGTATDGHVLTADGAGGAAWEVPTAVIPSDVQTFSTSGTWTKPSGVNFAKVEIVAGGGGGGNRVSASAAGGAGGEYVSEIFAIGDLGATETVTIGAGGAGAATGGENTGSAGGNTTFGSHLTALGGNGGAPSDGGTPGRAEDAVQTSGTQTAVQIGAFAGAGGDIGIAGQGTIYGGGGGAFGTNSGGASAVHGDGGGNGGNGTAPGGGGGGCATNNAGGGDGADGWCRVTCW